MGKVIFTRGLPGSGKSTYARELADKHGYVRISRDDIRSTLQLPSQAMNSRVETIVSSLVRKYVVTAIALGNNVVVDATNLNDTFLFPLIEVAAVQYQCAWDIVDFPMELDRLLERENNRPPEDRVGEHTIRKLYKRYKYHTWTDKAVLESMLMSPVRHYRNGVLCFLVDLDGTLFLPPAHSNMGDPDRDVLDDTVHIAVAETTRALRELGYEAILLSGRKSSQREDTVLALHAADVGYDELILRDEGDTRPDWIIKREKALAILEHKPILLALDDRDQVVDLYRNMGIPCFQVNDGTF